MAALLGGFEFSRGIGSSIYRLAATFHVLRGGFGSLRRRLSFSVIIEFEACELDAASNGLQPQFAAEIFTKLLEKRIERNRPASNHLLCNFKNELDLRGRAEQLDVGNRRFHLGC